MLSEMAAADNQQFERITKKVEADLAKLSLELKEYIDQKHATEVFDDSLGNTIDMLKESVDDNENLIKKVVISKLHGNDEEE